MSMVVWPSEEIAQWKADQVSGDAETQGPRWYTQQINDKPTLCIMSCGTFNIASSTETLLSC